jgi:hypothetical protein
MGPSRRPDAWEIRLWWRSHPEAWRGVDLAYCFDGPMRCMACRCAHYVHPDLQRAHIVARNRGGEDRPANIHLLCQWCHLASELLDGDPYWAWLRRRTPADCIILRAAVTGGIGPDATEALLDALEAERRVAPAGIPG